MWYMKCILSYILFMIMEVTITNNSCVTHFPIYISIRKTMLKETQKSLPNGDNRLTCALGCWPSVIHTSNVTDWPADI